MMLRRGIALPRGQRSTASADSFGEQHGADRIARAPARSRRPDLPQFPRRVAQRAGQIPLRLGDEIDRPVERRNVVCARFVSDESQ